MNTVKFGIHTPKVNANKDQQVDMLRQWSVGNIEVNMSTFWGEWQVDILGHGCVWNKSSNVSTLWDMCQVDRSTYWMMDRMATHLAMCRLCGVGERSPGGHNESWVYVRDTLVNVPTLWSGWQVNILAMAIYVGNILVNVSTLRGGSQVDRLTYCMIDGMAITSSKVSTWWNGWQIDRSTYWVMDM